MINAQGFRVEIDRGRLATVIGRSARTRKANSRVGQSATSWGRRGGQVTSAVLADTKRRHPGCRCEEKVGLREGMPVAELQELGSGCTGLEAGGQGWVCERLDLVRRRFGW